MFDKLKIWLSCKVFGHKFYVVQEFSPAIRRVGCSRCKKTWGMNDQVMAFIPWDNDLGHLYFDMFGHKEIKPWR